MEQQEQWWALLAAAFAMQLVTLALAWWACRRSKQLAEEVASALRYEASARMESDDTNSRAICELRYDIDGLASHMSLKRAERSSNPPRWEPKL